MSLPLPDQHPHVFVVGCPRSGTTLLQRMLNNHPDLDVCNDSHFITRAAKRELKIDRDPPMTDELLAQVLTYRRFHRLGIDDEDACRCAEGCRTYSQFVGRLYAFRAQRAGKACSGEKTPDFCRQIHTLDGLFPTARFIHIVRDGRDTALSALNWAKPDKGPGKWGLWQQDPVAVCALWWCWQTGSGVRSGARLPASRYLQVRYESLVADPEAQLRAISRFIGLKFSEKMGQYFKGKTINNPELSAKSAWRPPTPGLRNWRTEMPAEDIAVFEGIAGMLLAELGYPLSGHSPTSSVNQRLENSLAWWNSQKMSRS